MTLEQAQARYRVATRGYFAECESMLDVESSNELEVKIQRLRNAYNKVTVAKNAVISAHFGTENTSTITDLNPSSN